MISSTNHHKFTTSPVALVLIALLIMMPLTMVASSPSNSAIAQSGITQATPSTEAGGDSSRKCCEVEVLAVAWIPAPRVDLVYPPYHAFHGDDHDKPDRSTVKTTNRVWVSVTVDLCVKGDPIVASRVWSDTTVGYRYEHFGPRVYEASDTAIASYPNPHPGITTKKIGKILWLNIAIATGIPLLKSGVVPTIDFDYRIGLEKVGNTKQVNYWIYGEHDGFPSYAIWIGEDTGYKYFHDSKTRKQTPASLYPPMEWRVGLNCGKGPGSPCAGTTDMREVCRSCSIGMSAPNQQAGMSEEPRSTTVQERSACLPPGTPPPPPGTNPTAKVPQGAAQQEPPEERSSLQALQDRMKQRPQAPPAAPSTRPPPPPSGPPVIDQPPPEIIIDPLPTPSNPPSIELPPPPGGIFEPGDPSIELPPELVVPPPEPPAAPKEPGPDPGTGGAIGQ